MAAYPRRTLATDSGHLMTAAADNALGERIEAALERHLPAADGNPSSLYKAMRYAVLAPGKRIRPRLLYATGAVLDIEPKRRLAITVVLVLIATPYGYSYDAVPMAFATGYLFLTERRIPFPVHAVAWLFPLFVHLVNLRGIGATALVPLGYVAWNLWLAFGDQRREAAIRPA